MTRHVCDRNCPRSRPVKIRDTGIKVIHVCTCEGRTSEGDCLRCGGV